MPRLDRGIQYAAAYRFNHRRRWNTGSPAFAGDDACVGGVTQPQIKTAALPYGNAAANDAFVPD
jgi:hypothetical protein